MVSRSGGYPIDQLKEIWIDGELDAVETANWVPKLMRKDFTVAMSLSGSAVDDPDTQFYENYIATQSPSDRSKETISPAPGASFVAASTADRDRAGSMRGELLG
jgi:hypothetical protein